MTVRPFFERPSPPSPPRRRLLLISYHFPPGTSVGARRWEQLAHFVAERGWGLDVVTRLDAPPASTERLEALPAGVRLYGVPQPSLPIERVEAVAARAYGVLRDLRRSMRTGGGNGGPGAPSAAVSSVSLERHEIRWPPAGFRDVLRGFNAWLVQERERAWAREATACALAVVTPGVHDAVITSGPPHMAHDCGRIVSLRCRLPFVMDMRDPWSRMPMLHESFASPVWYRIAERHERRVIAQAALIVANNEPARAELAGAYPEASSRIITVLNGTDDYPLPPSRRGGRFTIGFAGTIYQSHDVRSLFNAAARVIAELALSPAEFGLEFIGDFDRPGLAPLAEIARQTGIAEFVSVGPVRPHAEALEFLAQATMLVVFSGFGSIFIPAKTFEYMRFGAWLLVLAAPESATAQLLAGTEADVVPPDDIAAIAAAIRRRYEGHVAGVYATPIARDDRFSRRKQAEVLLDAIERLCASDASLTPSSLHDTDARTYRTSYSR